jgi:hypothetical protein
LNEKVAASVKKTELTAGCSVALITRHLQEVGINFADNGGRSVGIVRLRAKDHGVFKIYFN